MLVSNRAVCLYMCFMLFCSPHIYIHPVQTAHWYDQTSKNQTRMATSFSHVVRNIDGIQLVGKERVAEVHALLLSPGVDGYDTRVNNYHHAHDEVVALQDHICDQGHEVKRVLL